MDTAVTDTPIWQQMISGRWYQTNAKPLRRLRQSVKALCYAINTESDSLRRQMLTDQLLPNAEGSCLQASFYCDYGLNITAGENLLVAANVIILDAAPVCVGKNVVIGNGSVIATLNHHPDSLKRLSGWQQANPVIIGDNVQIGANVTVLPGASIPSHSIIPDGTVVVASKSDDSRAMIIDAVSKQGLRPYK